jgi:beta-glucosidase
LDGGWLSEKTVDAYLEYARIVFNYFGGKVKFWLTFNEPHTFIRQGYSEGNHAPGRCSDRSKCKEGNSFIEPYLAAHNVLNAHAKAVSMFRELEATRSGLIGITLNGEWGESAVAAQLGQVDAYDQDSPSQRYLESQIGWFADPIKFGDYPESMRKVLGSRLPSFTVEERNKLLGSWDFFGFNFYNAIYVSEVVSSKSDMLPPGSPYWSQDFSLVSSGWNSEGKQMGLQAESPWLFESPGGFKNILLWLNDRYLDGKLPLYVTENGCSAPHESDMTFPAILADKWRVAYFFEYLEAMTSAMVEGVPVVGYFAWSLLDNFEWADGYQMRFGIHYVDFTDPNRPRYRKQSAHWYSALLNTLHLGWEESDFSIEFKNLAPMVLSLVLLFGIVFLVYQISSRKNDRSLDRNYPSGIAMEMPSMNIKNRASYSRIS